MDPGRRIVVHCAIATGGTGLWYLHPVRAARSSVAVATRRHLPVYLTTLGLVLAGFTFGIGSQVGGKLEELLFTAERRSPAE